MNGKLDTYNNLVYQKIGRNVVLFQEMECLLKYLAVNVHIEGYASEIQTIADQQTANIKKQTMGQVVGKFVEHTYTESEHTTHVPDKLKEPWLTFGYTIQGEGLCEKRKKALASIVAERNKLIHHFVPKWDWNSIESYKEVETYLDQQYEKIVVEFEVLQKTVKDLQEARQTLAEYTIKHFRQILELRQSQPMRLLGKISQQLARHDGWAVLSTAANALHRKAPGKIATLKHQYGFKTLKDMIIATLLFDIREEPTKKGGSRLLYRIKPKFNQ